MVLLSSKQRRIEGRNKQKVWVPKRRECDNVLFRVTRSVHSGVSMISGLIFSFPFPAFPLLFLSSGYYYFVMLSSTCKWSVCKIPLPHDVVCCLSFCICVILLKTSHTLGIIFAVMVTEFQFSWLSSILLLMSWNMPSLFFLTLTFNLFYLFATVNHNNTVS